MDCTIKKIKLCLWYPHFQVTYNPQHLFSWNSPKFNAELKFICLFKSPGSNTTKRLVTL